MSARTAAVALALILLAAGGYAGVRELTRPAAEQRVAPINVDPGAGEPPEPRRGERMTPRERCAACERRAERERRAARERARRRDERDRGGGFAPPPLPAQPAPATPAPAPPAPSRPSDDDDDGDDDDDDDGDGGDG